MNFIPLRKVAYFYDEENVEIGKLKIGPEKIHSGAEFSLWKHLVEIGEFEAEEESVEAVLDRLNQELGIEGFESQAKRAKTTTTTIDSIENDKPKSSSTNSYKHRILTPPLKPKIPSTVAKDEPSILYDVLMTRDRKSVV